MEPEILTLAPSSATHVTLFARTLATEALVVLIAAGVVEEGAVSSSIRRCGCFLDSPVAGTPYDGCPDCRGDGWSMTHSPLTFPQAQRDVVVTALESAGMWVDVLDTPFGPSPLGAESLDDPGCTNLDVRHVHYGSYVELSVSDLADLPVLAATLAAHDMPHELDERVVRLPVAHADDAMVALVHRGCWLSFGDADEAGWARAARLAPADGPMCRVVACRSVGDAAVYTETGNAVGVLLVNAVLLEWAVPHIVVADGVKVMGPYVRAAERALDAEGCSFHREGHDIPDPPF
ncbi:hypothetical protein GEV29_05555 [Aeromicrobium sp. SMF47]|uniref:hypothetical protein n=1 Tax=Aeromicrobium TaxID=2040 RepID=UPI00129D47BB|nr:MULTISPECIES: hypothetical protein [Aeromicrobium]MRJ75994.1 hypothetical protein [Aeromicrobium yanjiei]MRK00344.1 hypothetical protein [Aeromicrobium sp. S22]